MKKILFYFSSVALLLMAACSGSSTKTESTKDSVSSPDTTATDTSEISRKYDIKSGIITMNIVSLGEQKMTLYFDDFGGKECYETVSTIDMGMVGKIETFSKMIIKDGYLYNITDVSSKTGTKSKIKNDQKGKTENINFRNMTPEIMKELKIEKKGTETVMNRTCDVYSMNDTEKNIKSSYAVWKGITLKFEVNVEGQNVKATTTKIEENADIPASKFEIPKDVQFTEVK